MVVFLGYCLVALLALALLTAIWLGYERNVRRERKRRRVQRWSERTKRSSQRISPAPPPASSSLASGAPRRGTEPRPLRPVLAARVAAAHVALQSMSATATGGSALTWGSTRQRSSDAVSEHLCEALNQGIEWVRGSPFALRALDRFGIDPDPCTPPAGPSPWPAHPTRCARWRRSTKGRSPWWRTSDSHPSSPRNTARSTTKARSLVSSRY